MMRARQTWLGAFALALCVLEAGAAPSVETTVRVTADLASLAIRSCGPKGLEFHAPDARFRDSYSPREPHAWVREGCVEYTFALAEAAASRRSRDVVRVGRDAIAAAGAWLLQPVEALPGEIEFELPDSVRVSTPWRRIEGDPARFVLTPGTRGADALVAFAHRAPRVEWIGQARLEVAMLDSTPAINPVDTAIWVTAAARHATLAHGEFPVSEVQVLVVPVLGVWPNRRAGRLEAVPFARVLRNGGLTVQFFVNQSAPLREYLADWTATHEFSHLLLPYVVRSDAWVSEGFASYYQNVLMARAGVLDERRAWQKLLEGFDRGRREQYPDTLDESIRRHGPNMLMRMYWSGAAVALMADVALRRRSPPSSLDEALAALGRCCLDVGPTWSGLDLFRKLDALAGHDALTPLYASTAQATEFPNVDPVLAQLGVRRVQGRVVFDESASLSPVRRAIMSRRQ